MQSRNNSQSERVVVQHGTSGAIGDILSLVWNKYCWCYTGTFWLGCTRNNKITIVITEQLVAVTWWRCGDRVMTLRRGDSVMVWWVKVGLAESQRYWIAIKRTAAVIERCWAAMKRTASQTGWYWDRHTMRFSFSSLWKKGGKYWLDDNPHSLQFGKREVWKWVLTWLVLEHLGATIRMFKIQNYNKLVPSFRQEHQEIIRSR